MKTFVTFVFCPWQAISMKGLILLCLAVTLAAHVHGVKKVNKAFRGRVFSHMMPW